MRASSSNTSTSHDQCRICGSCDTAKFEAQAYVWWKCFRCLGIQKQLTYDEYQALNPTYDPGAYLNSKDRNEIERHLNVAQKRRFLSKCVQAFATKTNPAARFLDVGCGMGGYMLAAQQLGFQVLGFEPSLNHAHVAKDVLNLPVITDYFSIEQLNQQSFDVVMLSHVIEHIYEPGNMVRSLISILKPGGILIIVTPNTQSLIARITGKRWVMLRPVDHVSMISALAYRHFDFGASVKVYHRFSEYSFEFAATIAATFKAWIAEKKQTAYLAKSSIDDAGPSIMRRIGVMSKVLRFLLSVISAPAHFAAILSGRQACLITLIVREA